MPMLPSRTLDEEHGFPHFRGKQCRLALNTIVSLNQDLKLPTAHTTVALAGAWSQGVQFTWSELLAEHTVGLEALRTNPSKEELLDFCQGS